MPEAKLTEHQIDVLRAVRKKILHPLQSFTRFDMWPEVKRADYVFGLLESKGYLTGRYTLGTGEKHYRFTKKVQTVLNERW